MNITRINPELLLPAEANTHPSFVLTRFGQRWMTYRHEPPPFNDHTCVAMACCDELWNPAGAGSVMVPHGLEDNERTPLDDCRLLSIGDETYFHVNNRKRIGIGKLFNPTPFAWLDIPGAADAEKNWLFFEHDHQVYGIRWVRPHEVYRVTLNFKSGHTCELLHVDKRDWPWSWGTIHGGTTPVRYGNLYVSIFHSFTIGFPSDGWKFERTEKSVAGDHKVYFAAPYAFHAHPPFEIAMVPTEPMLWPRILPEAMRSPNGEYTVFPTGLIRDGDNWLCGYGDDRFCWKAEFTTEELFQHMRTL